MPVDQMIERADAAGGDDRNVHGVGDAARQGNVEAVLAPSRSIEVSRISPAPSAATSARIVDRVDAGGAPPAMGEDLPARLA